MGTPPMEPPSGSLGGVPIRATLRTTASSAMADESRGRGSWVQVVSTLMAAPGVYLAVSLFTSPLCLVVILYELPEHWALVRRESHPDEDRVQDPSCRVNFVEGSLEVARLLGFLGNVSGVFVVDPACVDGVHVDVQSLLRQDNETCTTQNLNQSIIWSKVEAG